MKKIKSPLQVKSISWHRNGRCNPSFHTVLFDWNEDGELLENLLATVFKDESYCGVVSLKDSTQRFIGRYFEKEIRKAITQNGRNNYKKMIVESLFEN